MIEGIVKVGTPLSFRKSYLLYLRKVESDFESVHLLTDYSGC
jgi:hypothetical protein